MRINLYAILCALALISCKEDGAIPAYIILDEFTVAVEPGEGSASDKITDAWVFVDGQSIGAYQLPAEIPVIADGPTLLDIRPVVKENGIIGNSIMYPFYEKVSGTFDLKPGEKRKIELVTEYLDGLEFAVLEDFEGGHFFTNDIDGDRQTEIVITDEDVFEGENSGRIVLTEENPLLQAGWQDAFTPVRSERAWVELNYKTNIPFIIGLNGARDGVPLSDYTTFVNTKNEWNKIYFNFTSLIDPTVFDVVQLVIVGLWSEGNEVEEAEILIDNVKLIRQK